MLREKTKSITLKANSAVEVTEADGTVKLVNVEGYTCTINSDNPVDINIGKYFVSTQAKALYKEHREECHADYAAFENECYALQDEMIAEKNAAEVTEEVEVPETI